MGFNLKLVAELTLAQNFNKLVFTYHTSLHEVGNGNLFETILLGECLKLEVEAHAFSKKAEEIITAAGGSIVKL